jgi:hypothetical protein
VNKHTFIVGLAAVVIVSSYVSHALAQGATTTLYGEWQLDNAKTREVLKAEERRDVPWELLYDRVLAVTLEFHSNGSTRTGVRFGRDGTSYAVGDWKVLSEQNGQLTLETNTTQDGNSTKIKSAVRFLDKDTIRLENLETKDPGLHLMILRRVAPQPAAKD